MFSLTALLTAKVSGFHSIAPWPIILFFLVYWWGVGVAWWDKCHICPCIVLKLNPLNSSADGNSASASMAVLTFTSCSCRKPERDHSAVLPWCSVVHGPEPGPTLLSDINKSCSNVVQDEEIADRAERRCDGRCLSWSRCCVPRWETINLLNPLYWINRQQAARSTSESGVGRRKWWCWWWCREGLVFKRVLG